MPAECSGDEAIRRRLPGLFRALHAAARGRPAPTAAWRRDALARLASAVREAAPTLADAVDADFGHRSVHETKLLELFPSLQAMTHARRRLGGWMRPRRRAVSPWFWPARARVIYQPLGVVGIVVPWNYPLYLALGPLAGALAAGNRVLIKTSEYAPRSGEQLARLLAGVFRDDEVVAVGGGPAVAQDFTALPFDHLLFTGSAAVGRAVMRAAGACLTPVTLELGGKCPAIIGVDARWEAAVERIVVGKLLNAGQTCIAPDYVLVPEGSQGRFERSARAVVARLYPRLAANPDYSSIVDERQYRRLDEWLWEAAGAGARVVSLAPGGEMPPAATRKLAPTLVLGVTPAMRLGHSEIFGPVLPVLTYATLEAALAHVNDGPSPLALYYFGTDPGDVQRVIQGTRSGGVTVNDTLLHVGQEDLPFGGVGGSGMGHYHGRDGFLTFSKARAVLYQSRWSPIGLANPPYGRVVNALLGFMLGGGPWRR